MSMVGADTQQLRALATLFERQGRALETLALGVTRTCMESPWTGVDAASFRGDWNRVHLASLRSVASMLAEVARRLMEQAQQQDEASQAGRGGSGWDRPRPGRDDLADVLRDYQVQDDEMTMFPGPPLSWVIDPVKVTATEAALLSTLSLLKLKKMQEIKDKAFAEARRQFPGDSMDASNDGHQDAFRHAYWNALMTKEFGEDFTRRFTTAHEGVPGNQADREAMDLYNNEVGRRIATANPDASADELARLVRSGVDRGAMVVIASDGNLAYSDEVAFGDHGQANDRPGGGGMVPGGANSGDYVHGTGS